MPRHSGRVCPAHAAATLGGALFLVQAAPGAVLFRTGNGVVQAFPANRAGGTDQLRLTLADFALRLARHFVASQAAISSARVTIEQYPWERLAGHSFVRSGREVRTATVTHDGATAWTVSGLRDLVLLNSKGSEFWGFARDQYTTLAETKDRILATAVNARWRHAGPQADQQTDWAASYRTARDLMISAFAQTYSYSLQQTLYAMGRRLLEGLPEIAEVRLSLPNKHHFIVDLAPFGLDNDR